MLPAFYLNQYDQLSSLAWSEDATAEPGEDRGDALGTLRNRYAQGELTDEQFERKVERLLETETLEDVEARKRRAREERQRERE
jgi:hypothetical protein